MRLTNEDAVTSCGKRYELFHEGILKGNVGQVERTLKTYQKEAVNLMAQHCFWAMKEAIVLNQEEIALLILNYAEKVYEEEIITNQLQCWRILVLAVGQNFLSIVEKLMDKKVGVDDSLLWIAFQEGYAEIAEVLITAGCSPEIVLTEDHRFFMERYKGESHKEVWKVLLPHWTAEDVMNSSMVELYIRKHSGEDLVMLMEGLGMDFLACISSRGSAATKCMEVALWPNDHQLDLGTIQFLLDHEFDVNTYIDTKPILHHLLMSDRYSDNIHALVLDVINQGANPLLRDSKEDKNAVEACCLLFLHSDTEENKPYFLKVLKLLVRLGFKIPNYMIDDFTKNNITEDDLISENSSIPSLQILCRKEIRVAAGSRIMRLMNQLQYPQTLKNFVLLKDIDLKQLSGNDHHHSCHQHSDESESRERSDSSSDTE